MDIDWGSVSKFQTSRDVTPELHIIRTRTGEAQRERHLCKSSQREGEMAAQTPGAFDVNVKDFRGGSVVVSVLPAWNVSQVKQEIARKMDVAAPEFKLVFAGQTLSDSITLAVSWVPPGK